MLDLARLADLARRRGETGTMPWLAPFFKSPLGVEEQDFAKQHAALMAWAAAPSGPVGGRSSRPLRP